jgi:hypothetical protein
MPNPPPVQAAREPVHAQLFMLRIWQEDLGEGRSEWRGKVQHVTSGEARYFRDWPGLIACLQQILENPLEQPK